MDETQPVSQIDEGASSAEEAAEGSSERVFPPDQSEPSPKLDPLPIVGARARCRPGDMADGSRNTRRRVENARRAEDWPRLWVPHHILQPWRSSLAPERRYDADACLMLTGSSGGAYIFVDDLQLNGTGEPRKVSLQRTAGTMGRAAPEEPKMTSLPEEWTQPGLGEIRGVRNSYGAEGGVLVYDNLGRIAPGENFHSVLLCNAE